MPSIYALKPRFQGMLRPAVAAMARAGITANQVTLFACAASVAVGIFLCNRSVQWLLILPPFFFARMALNAVDGMLAREFGQKSRLGAYLNELTDVVADAFLYLPFAYLPGFDPLWIGVVIVLAVISEMTGVIGVMTGASRRYDGPMGKSDRAFVFGALALWMGLGGPVSPDVATGFILIMAVLLAMTIANRVRKGLKETGELRISS
jgi:CDP-diacylglycerol--glycerol-3-phosphate 3-phosphatidyltransferase